MEVSVHPSVGRVNTYAAPASSPPASLPWAPTAMMFPSPLTDTEWPNRSRASSTGALRRADVDVAIHPPEGFVNTYAAPGASGDPATIVLPSLLTDTDSPSCARASTSSGPVKRIAVDADAHPLDGRVNTYTEPGESPRAPTATMLPSPLADTDAPSWSPAAASDAVSLTAEDAVTHPLDGRVNTYAAPASPPPESLPRAPMVMVLPSALMDAELPKRSPAAASDAVNLTAVDIEAHPVDGFANTYAAPASAPPESLPGAPTTIVFPSALIDAELPKRSPAAASDAVNLPASVQLLMLFVNT